jgi:hypothetical protein
LGGDCGRRRVVIWVGRAFAGDPVAGNSKRPPTIQIVGL